MRIPKEKQPPEIFQAQRGNESNKMASWAQNQSPVQFWASEWKRERHRTTVGGCSSKPCPASFLPVTVPVSSLQFIQKKSHISWLKLANLCSAIFLDTLIMIPSCNFSSFKTMENKPLQNDVEMLRSWFGFLDTLGISPNLYLSSLKVTPQKTYSLNLWAPHGFRPEARLIFGTSKGLFSEKIDWK